MLFNSYSYEILYKQFHSIYLQGDVKLLLVTVNNRLKFEIEIVHDLSCHPIKDTAWKCSLTCWADEVLLIGAIADVCDMIWYDMIWYDYDMLLCKAQSKMADCSTRWFHKKWNSLARSISVLLATGCIRLKHAHTDHTCRRKCVRTLFILSAFCIWLLFWATLYYLFISKWSLQSILVKVL